MKTQENLHELIQTLSKSEKVFFKKFAALYTTNEATGYLRLFEIIEDSNEYNESAIEKKMRAEFPSGNFSYIKNYLKKSILRSLRAIREESTPNIAFSEMLTNVELLRERKMYGMSEKELQKARKHLEQFELYQRFSELAHWERQFIYRKPNNEGSIEEFKSLNDQELEIFERVKNVADYYLLSYRLLVFIRTKGNIRDAETKKITQDIMQDPLLVDESKALSVLAKSFYFNCNLIYSDLVGENDKLHDLLKNHLELLDTNRFFVENNEWKLVVCLYNYAVSIISLERHEEYEPIHRRLLDMYEKNKNSNLLLKNNIEVLLVNIELRHTLSLRIIERIEQIQSDYEGSIKEEDLKSNPHIVVENYLMLSYGHLLNGDIKHALKWNNIIINSKISGLREDMFSMARILNLIIHYELGNDVLLMYNIRSTLRYLEKMNTLKEFENLILQFIKLLIEFDKKSNHTERLMEIGQKINELKSDVFEKQAFYIIDLTHWIELKIEESKNPRKFALKKNK